MIEFQILYTRLAQFTARFEPVAGGNYAYFPNDWSEGLLVTPAEHAAMLGEYQAVIERVRRVLKWYVPIAVIFALVVVFANHGDAPRWGLPIIVCPPLLWTGWQLYRADRLPLRQRRMAVSPPRGFKTGARTRVVALGLWVPLGLIGLGMLLLGRLGYDGDLITKPGYTAAALAEIALGMFILLLHRKG